jgi:uncharacterized protein
VSLHIDSDGIELRSYLAVPATGVTGRGLVLCHGFPQAPREAASAGLRYGELADRIAEQTDMSVLTFNFRGTGQSEGDFSLGGWSSDLRAALAHLRNDGMDEIWLLGFGVGGSLALWTAAQDPEIRGVCSLSARATFDDWAEHSEELIAHARRFGMIRSADFPHDHAAWTEELKAIRPLDAMPLIPPRPVMLIHGVQDDRVPVADARALADAAGHDVDLRIVHGAGHRLRHDPRIVALLLGWLERQQ